MAKSIEKFIEEYYSNLTLKTIDDYEEAIDKSIKNAEFRYLNSILNSTYSPNPNPNAKTTGKINTFVQDNKLSCFESFRHSASNPMTLMGMFNLAVAKAAEGYTALNQKDDHKYEYAFKADGARQFIMRKPESMQEDDLKTITDGITALYKKLVEEENTLLLDADKALAYATTEYKKAEEAYTTQLQQTAKTAADKTAQAAIKKAKAKVQGEK